MSEFFSKIRDNLKIWKFFSKIRNNLKIWRKTLKFEIISEIRDKLRRTTESVESFRMNELKSGFPYLVVVRRALDGSAVVRLTGIFFFTSDHCRLVTSGASTTLGGFSGLSLVFLYMFFP
jgi:hypothetical protein